MTKAIYIAALLSACSMVSLSQDSSWVNLDQAEVVASRPDHVFEQRYSDSLQLLHPSSGSLADLLLQNGLWNLRTYGPQGTVVTGAEQGLLPDHTTVYWEGIPLNSPSLGLVDLSQIPLALFSDVSAQSQPIMSANPVQSIGPSIELASGQSGSSQGVAGISVNNLSNFSSWANLNYSIGKVKLESRGFHRTNRNEFTYTDPWKQGTPTLSATHNDHKLSAFIQHARLQITPNSQLSMGVWLQGGELSLPEQLGSYGQSFATQTDSSLRIMARLNGQLGKVHWKVKSALLKEQQHYVDRQAENGPTIIDSRIRTSRWVLESSFTRLFGDLKLVAEPLIQQDIARSNYYSEQLAEQWQVMASLQAVWFRKQWNVRALIRQDLIRANALPVVQLAAQRTLRNGVFEVGTAHIYRLPDLNERFWIPGGNEFLNPESGLKSFMRIRFNESSQLPALTAEIFSHQMKEMIQWLPEGGVFSAVNTGRVAVNGGSLSILKSKDWPIGRGQLHAQLKGEHYSVLPYYFPQGAPNWSARGLSGFRFTRKNTTFHTQVRANVNQWNPGIPAYTSNRVNIMHDAGIDQRCPLGDHELNIQLVVQNIWDQTDWSAMYAMPGRVLTLQIQYSFQSQQLKKQP